MNLYDIIKESNYDPLRFTTLDDKCYRVVEYDGYDSFETKNIYYIVHRKKCVKKCICMKFERGKTIVLKFMLTFAASLKILYDLQRSN